MTEGMEKKVEATGSFRVLGWLERNKGLAKKMDMTVICGAM